MGQRATVMLRAISSAQRCLLITALSISCFAISGCVESTFELASRSRLPAWISLPDGLTRADVSVTLTYYTLVSAKFQLKDKAGKSLGEFTGKVLNSYPLQLPGCKGRRCPAFEVVVVNGAIEVMVHKAMEPIFYVNENRGIRGWALTEVGLVENRKTAPRDPYRAWRYGQLRPN